MTRDWRPVLYTDADAEELVTLCQAQLGKAAAITPAYVRWQHSANPAGQAQVGLAKENGSDRIVGVVWLMPLRIQVGHEITLGSQSMYALVAPDYRRQGIFTTLVKFADQKGQQQGYQFSYGFPNPNSYPGFVGRLGWTEVGQARLYLRPLDTGRLVRRRLGRGLVQGALAATAKTGKHLLFRPRPLPSGAAGITVRDEDVLSPAMDDYWQRIRTKYPIMVARDTRFLDWRYKQIPDRHYQLWSARQNGQIVATIALRATNIEGIDCGMVVDLLAEPSERGRLGGEVLLLHAELHFRRQDLDMAGCLMLPHAEEIGLLHHQGYVACPRGLQPQPFPVVVRVQNGTPGPERMLHLSNWFLTMGDFDAI